MWPHSCLHQAKRGIISPQYFIGSFKEFLLPSVWAQCKDPDFLPGILKLYKVTHAHARTRTPLIKRTWSAFYTISRQPGTRSAQTNKQRELQTGVST